MADSAYSNLEGQSSLCILELKMYLRTKSERETEIRAKPFGVFHFTPQKRDVFRFRHLALGENSTSYISSIL
jgi:hypothetical protein